MNYRHYASFFTGAAAAAVMLTSPGTPATAQGSRTVTLNAGTVIPVRLRDTLSSSDSRKGDRFTATLESTEAARSLGLPVGTEISGTVAAVRTLEGNNPG